MFVSDLDGTLFPTSYGMSKNDTSRLVNLIDTGLPFTPATGRSIPSALQVLGQPELKFGIIANNGAVVMNGAGKIISQTEMPWGPVMNISDNLRNLALPFVWSLDAGTGFERWYWLPAGPHHLDVYLESRKNYPGISRMSSLKIPRNNFCLNLTTYGPKDLLLDLQSEFDSPELTIQVMPDTGQRGVYMMFFQGETDKGEALRALCRAEGIALRDVTAFGDDASDVSMFGAAGRAIAVGGGEEEAINAADEIIEPAISLSVLNLLEHYSAAQPVR